MNNLEFLDYIATPGESYMGVAEVKWNGLILRYKIVPNKTGDGTWFPTMAAYKVRSAINSSTGKDEYAKSVEIDSNTDQKKVIDFVTSHVKVRLHQTGIKTGQSSMPPVTPSLPAAWGIAPPLPVQESLPF
jgi:hypothetical protein